MITIIKRKYIPTDASVIRALALAKGLSELGEEVRIIFLLSNNGLICDKRYKNVSFLYLGESNKNVNKVLMLINSLIRLKRILHRDDIVILMSYMFSLFMILACLFDVNLYHERTEYPLLSSSKGFIGKIQEFFYMKIVKKTSGVFVISRKIYDYFLERGIPKEKLQIVNMLVDDSRFNKLIKQNVKEPYIAYCGTISNYKDGVDTLLRAFSKVAKCRDNIKLYILGRSIPADYEVNKKIINDEGISDRVYMPGVISNDLMPQYLKNAEALVLARPNNIQAAYGFPTKLGEYLMTSNPVIVTRVGEIDNFLVDMESCIFALPDNYEDFANKILWVLDNKEEANKIGLGGYDVARRNFNYLTEASRMLQMIKKTI